MTGAWAQDVSLGPWPTQVEDTDLYVLAKEYHVLSIKAPHRFMLTSVFLQACATLETPLQPIWSQFCSSESTAAMAHQARPELMERHQEEMTVRADRPSGIREWTVCLKGHLVANATEASAYGSDTKVDPRAIEICF